MTAEISTISKKRPPLHMDFERLRAEGIRHLEELATQIWTDFNAHDPGITILEVLCYALTDLGYRASLPLEDLLAAEPGKEGTVFFPASKTLGTCPVTENDFRKLIIDVAGVKNAWLKKADITELDSAYKLNGIYDVQLELHDNTLEPFHEKAKDIIEVVQKKLHRNRNLCEDFNEIKLVDKQTICLCLHLELIPSANAEEAMVKAIFNLQEYLAPAIRFYNLQQLLEKNKAGDEIYNGPILENGFIDNEELERAILPEKIYTSDLYKVLMQMPEVLSVKELKLKLDIKGRGDEVFKEDWCFELAGKPVIDPCCSNLHVSQGAKTLTLDGEQLEEQINFLRFVNLDIPDSNVNELPIPEGTYRPDLADHLSIQHEFPRTYYLGEEGLPDSATTKRKAQVKQLQAYLLFYDRLLADYLKQLSKVRDIFSSDQNEHSQTVFFQTLYNVPGIADLLSLHPSFSPQKAAVVLDFIQKEIIDKNLVRPKRAREILEGLQADIGLEFKTEKELEEWIHHWVCLFRDETARIKISAELKKTVNGPEKHITELKKISFGVNDEQERKNLLLDHLLARFGEQFSDYVLDLFQHSVVSNNYGSFENYLNDKMAFLGNVTDLGMARAKAYNCKLFKKGEGVTDVWNTDNVSGLKKKICSLTGIAEKEKSIFYDPPYRVGLKRDNSKKYPYFFLQLVETDDGGKIKNILLSSLESYRKKKAEKYEDLLYEGIGTSGVFEIKKSEEDNKLYYVEYIYGSGKEEIIMVSNDMSKKSAEQCLSDMKELIDPEGKEIEGFHIVEHILLRRDDDEGEKLNDLELPYDKHDDIEPYSFWMSVLLPGWVGRFANLDFRHYFEQLFLMETPAHIAVCFHWVGGNEKDTVGRQWMKKFEHAFEKWREEKAKCRPNECNVTEYANALVELLNEKKCDCYFEKEKGEATLCGGETKGNSIEIEEYKYNDQ